MLPDLNDQSELFLKNLVVKTIKIENRFRKKYVNLFLDFFLKYFRKIMKIVDLFETQNLFLHLKRSYI